MSNNTLTLTVTLIFSDPVTGHEQIKQVVNNVQDALEHWRAEVGLAPEDDEGFGVATTDYIGVEPAANPKPRPKKMTNKQIKEMFAAGQIWTGVLVDARFPKNNSTTTRTILEVRSKFLIYGAPHKKDSIYLQWPQAKEVEEAWPGHLKFTYADVDVTVTLDRVS